MEWYGRQIHHYTYLILNFGKSRKFWNTEIWEMSLFYRFIILSDTNLFSTDIYSIRETH